MQRLQRLCRDRKHGIHDSYDSESSSSTEEVREPYVLDFKEGFVLGAWMWRWRAEGRVTARRCARTEGHAPLPAR